jgi:integrase
VKLSVLYRPSAPASASPYRLLDEQGEIAWANSFLDAQRIRQLSVRSLRAYAYDLLYFARWSSQQPAKPLSEVTESTLLDYVRYQLDQQPKPTPQTVNHRLVVLHCLFRFHFGTEIPPGQSHFQRTYTKRSPLGYGRPRRAMALGLRLKQPRRIIVPLSAEQVATFWHSFHSFRDLTLVGLMLLDGLRSVRFSLFSSKTFNWLMRRCASSARGIKHASCLCPVKSLMSCKSICGWKGL